MQTVRGVDDMCHILQHRVSVFNAYTRVLNMGVSARSIEVRFSQSGNLSPSSDQCVQPSLELWPPSFKQFFERPSSLECSQTEDNWVFFVSD